MSDGAGSFRLLTYGRQTFALDHDVAVNVSGLRSDPSAIVAGGLENGTAKADTLSWDRHKRWCEFYNTPATRTTACFLEKPSPHVKAGSHVNGISNI